jgi:tetratricopeptide (TPR) repeat protein
MVSRLIVRRSLAICAVVLAAAVFAAPGFAQTGQIKGKVVDAENKPVEGAIVVVQSEDGGNRKFQLKTDRKGEYLQIGIQPGNYTVTATKGNLTQTFSTRISLDMKEVNFALKPGGVAAAMTKEDAAKKIAGIQAKYKQAFDLINAEKYDEATKMFNEVLADVPKCAECYIGIAAIHMRKNEPEPAEAAYKKAIELNPEGPDAYSGLAALYNAQKKFKEAGEMGAEAAKRSAAANPGGAGDPTSFYNQGVIAWNGNDFAKAQEHFESALKADPNHAESHFMLGKVYINLGKLAEAATEFETYIKLAPTGRNAKEAQSNFDQLKSFRK